jgi:hypothetical protein
VLPVDHERCPVSWLTSVLVFVQDVGWQPVLGKWMTELPNPLVRRVMSGLVHSYVPKCLSLASLASRSLPLQSLDEDVHDGVAEKTWRQEAPLAATGFSDVRVVTCFLDIFLGCLNFDGVTTLMDASLRAGSPGWGPSVVRSLEKYFVFALVWAAAGDLSTAGAQHLRASNDCNGFIRVCCCVCRQSSLS